MRSYIAALIVLVFCGWCSADTRVTFDENRVMQIDGHKLFIISFAMAPPFDGKTPSGRAALEELRAAGGNFIRTAPKGTWDDAAITAELSAEEQAAKFGIYCWPSLKECAAIGDNAVAREAMLRKIVKSLKSSPGLGGYKGVDEPAWGKTPLPSMMRARAIIKSIDSDHPIFVLHAPRNEIPDLKAYNPATDITGADIFPIGYPPGNDSRLPNHEISCVADYTARMMEVADGKLPVMMTLGIAWSGVGKPGKTLRFPTFHEMRYMTYAAIIKGARGVNFFGGTIQSSLTPDDAKLGWNWTYWNNVLKRLVEEIGDHGSLYPALIAPDARLPIHVQFAPETDGAKTAALSLISNEIPDIDFCIRQTSDGLYLIAAKREGKTIHVHFSGLPADGTADVLFESPRTVEIKSGALTDWFAPNEVHVYRLKR